MRLKEFFASRRTKHGGSAMALVALVVALFYVVNLILLGLANHFAWYFYTAEQYEITVSGALTFVGEGAFTNCDGLKQVTFSNSPDAIDFVPFEAFRGCTGLREITLPKNYVVIDETAFSGCSSLERLTLLNPECLIANGAFEKCEKLAVVYYGGSEAQLDVFLTLCVASGNTAITKNANLYVYSASEPKGESDYNGYWHYTEDGKIRLWNGK